MISTISISLPTSTSAPAGRRSCLHLYGANCARWTASLRRPMAHAAPRQPTILVFGLKPERLLDREGRIDAFVEPPTQEQGSAASRPCAPEPRRAATSWRSCRSGSRATACCACRWSSRRSTTRRLSIHETPLPPLAGAVLASLASSIAPYLPSTGVLASLLPELEARLHVFTWLGSVSGLSVPAPSLGQHLASLSPGSAFGVSSYPGAVRPPARPRPRRRARCREIDAPVGHGRQRPRRRRGVDRRRQRAARRPAGAPGRADAQRALVVGHREAGRERRASRSTSRRSAPSWPPPPAPGRAAGAAS